MRAEFDLIAEVFAPLAKGFPGALGLLDDAAILRPQPGRDLVFTKDLMVSGVHFRPTDPADRVAKKLLRVNLSDLAAMGAAPIGYGLGIAVPKGFDEKWLREFAAGLGADQGRFGITLLGGDTVATPGPLTLSLTALGDLPTGRALKRSGALAGDLIMVSGTIGDGFLGLRVASGDTSGLSVAQEKYLLDRLQLPHPRLTLGQGLLSGLGHAAVDISDGLVADLGHMCRASGLGAVVRADRVPVSAAATAYLEGHGDLGAHGDDVLPALLSGGDDYELLFAVAPADRDQVLALGDELGVPVAVIGHLIDGQGVTVLDGRGLPLSFRQTGYRHF